MSLVPGDLGETLPHAARTHPAGPQELCLDKGSVDNEADVIAEGFRFTTHIPPKKEEALMHRGMNRFSGILFCWKGEH